MQTELSNNIGKKVLVMTEYYPFFFVGILEKAENEEIWVCVKFGVSAALKNKVFQVRLDAISALFVEDDENEIPDTW